MKVENANFENLPQGMLPSFIPGSSECAVNENSDVVLNEGSFSPSPCICQPELQNFVKSLTAVSEGIIDYSTR